MGLNVRLEWLKNITKNYNDSINRIVSELEKTTADRDPDVFFYPIVVRKRLAWAIDPRDVDGYGTMQLRKNIAGTDLRFEEFKKAHEEEFAAILCIGLKALIARYDPRVSGDDAHALEIVTEKRTDIEILYNELMALLDLKDPYFDTYFEIRDLYVEGVKAHDDRLRMEIERSLVAGKYSPDNVPGAPEDYWWLHVEDAFDFNYADDIPAYEEKDPEELIRIAKKLLARGLGAGIDRRAREMLELARDAKRKRVKVKIYY